MQKREELLVENILLCDEKGKYRMKTKSEKEAKQILNELKSKFNLTNRSIVPNNASILLQRLVNNEKRINVFYSEKTKRLY